MMNAHNTHRHDHECSPDAASIDLERLLTSAMPRTKLLPLVQEKVKLAIVQFAQHALLSNPMADASAPAKVVDYLRRAAAIPLQPQLCTLMARVGFDKSLFTYGHVDGVPVGYAEGAWLLTFVEPVVSEPSAWLQLLSSIDRRYSAALHGQLGCSAA
jgi:hypothetical protein